MLSETREWERMFEERVEEIRGGYIEPLSTMIDGGQDTTNSRNTRSKTGDSGDHSNRESYKSRSKTR